MTDSAKITFSLFRDSRLRPSKLLVGQLEIKLAALLELSARRGGEELSLSLERKKQGTGELMVRIQDASTSALASAMGHLPGALEDLPGSRTRAAADVISAADTAVNSSLVGSFTSLMETMNIVIKIGDEIAKACFKLVKAQKDRDSKVTNLTQIMQSTYSIILGSQTLKDDETLQDVLERILKQTVVCGFFIQDYVSRRSAVREALSSTDKMIDQYQTAFQRLRDDYLGRISTYTALVTKDVLTTVREIRHHQLLENLRPEVMDQTKRGTCLPNTRLDTIKAILDWYSDDSDDQARVLWMFGLAGTGKSTLATTIAGMLEEINLLGAFFFFDRQLPARDPSTLIRTLAFQLAQSHATIGVKIAQVIQDTLNIANMNLAMQFQKLLSATALGDVDWSRGPLLVVIDALDESGSEAERKTLLQVLSKGFANLPRFLRFLIVSRPVRDISDRFNGPAIRRRELGIDSSPDIEEFIRSRLHEIKEANITSLAELLQSWPSEDDIRSLAALAAGLFIWAATACRLIDESHDPTERTNELIKNHSANIRGSVFENLHLLYKTALQSAGNWDDKSFRSDFRDVVGTVICAQGPLSCSAVDSLLDLPRPSLHTVLRLGSVLCGNREEPIRILHTSFYDYLTLRDPVELWAIDNEWDDMRMADRCLVHLEQTLHENMWSLTLPFPVPDKSLPDSVSYASKYWFAHVCSIKNVPDDLCDRMDRFLRKHLLHWMEALVINKAFEVTLHQFPRLLQWIQEFSPKSQLYRMAHDAHRFAQYFSNTIQEHPLLIYHSALPFAPHDTLIYQTYYHERLPRVVCDAERRWSNLLQVFRGHKSAVEGVAFSPNGHQLASSGGWERTVRVWNLSSGQEALPPIRGHGEASVNCVAFSPDGSKIASGSSDGKICIWDAHTGELSLPPLLGHKQSVRSVRFSPDGLKIASASNDQTIRVWDLFTGKEVMPPLEGHVQPLRTVVFSPDGHVIASGSEDHNIQVWDALTGERTLLLRGHDHWVLSVAFSPDGNTIVSGSADKTVRMWDTRTGQETMSPLQSHTDLVCSVDFSRDGSRIVSASRHEIIVWNALTGQETLSPITGNDFLSAVFSPDASKIVVGMGNGDISLWDVLEVQPEAQPPQGHEMAVRCAAISQDGTMIVSGSPDNTIRLWDTLTGKQNLPPLRVPEGKVMYVAFSPDGSRVVSVSDTSIKVWDTLTGQEVLPPLLPLAPGIGEIFFSPDGSKIISHSKTDILMWDALTGQRLPPFQSQYDQAATISSIAISLDGKWMVSGGSRTVRVWNILTMQEALPPIRGHEGLVSSVAIAPDGSKIVSGSFDKTIRLWNALTGEHVLPPLSNHDEKVSSVAFSADGLRIISRSRWEVYTRVWDALTGQELSQPPREGPTIAPTLNLPMANDPSSQASERSHGGAAGSSFEPEKLVHFGPQGYFVEVNSGRHLGKVPTDSFDLGHELPVIREIHVWVTVTSLNAVLSLHS
ncbi:hypothetical protein HWV62_1877 [Athelia sp. TMB]|nr:hypothetical protein HWV62_1877 [Athelia sp. TMB]